MTKAWHIKDWADRENADTRKYVDLLWFRNKVKLLGEGLGHTLGQPNGRGPHLYGMFKLIEQIAAGGRQDQRGWLFRNGSPMDAYRIASLLRLPVADCQEALTFFSTPPLDWLELVEYLPTSGRLPGESPDPLPSREEYLPTSGRLPGESPDPLPHPGMRPGEMRHPTDRPTDRSTKNNQERKKETRKAEATPEDAKNQARQWRAAKGRLEDLEAIPEDDRTSEQEADLKKTRALIRAIQKKQAAGDFMPLREEVK